MTIERPAEVSTWNGAPAASARHAGGVVVRHASVVLAIVLLTALGARVGFPLPVGPVPMTLQTVAVLLAGFLLPAPLALSSMLAYVAAGSVFPFMFGPGSVGLAGPTGGYLLGFVMAAPVVSLLAHGRAPSWPRSLAAASAGTVLIFAGGLVGLALWLGGDAQRVVEAGLLPFVPAALIKIALVASGARIVHGGVARHRTG